MFLIFLQENRPAGRDFLILHRCRILTPVGTQNFILTSFRRRIKTKAPQTKITRTKSQLIELTFPLTHYRPAMPFGNRKIYFRGSFKFSIVII